MTDEQKFAIDRTQRAIKELNQAVKAAAGVNVIVDLEQGSTGGFQSIDATYAFAPDAEGKMAKTTFD
jgi:hypothetical protein